MNGCCIWFTGLPSSGKTTLAREISDELKASNVIHDVIDGDELRAMFPTGTGFSKTERIENCKTISFLVSKIAKHGGIAIVSIIAPYQEMRDHARKAVEAEGGIFIEVFVDASIETCIQRDVKGLYKKAISGEINHFTGISDPYEIPVNPEIHLKTSEKTINACIEQVLSFLLAEKILESYQGPATMIIGTFDPIDIKEERYIRYALSQKPVILGITNDEEDTGVYDYEERVAMLKALFVGEDIEFIFLPPIVDVVSKVWSKREFPGDTKISFGQEIERQLANNEDSWKGKVPDSVVKYIEERWNTRSNPCLSITL